MRSSAERAKDRGLLRLGKHAQHVKTLTFSAKEHPKSSRRELPHGRSERMQFLDLSAREGPLSEGGDVVLHALPKFVGNVEELALGVPVEDEVKRLSAWPHA